MPESTAQLIALESTQAEFSHGLSVMGTSLRERRRHRSWPEALKREIVAATLVPGSSASVVARHYDVNVNQVFAWRKRYRTEAREPTDLRLLPVTVTPDEPSAAVPVNDVIEIELSGGYRVRIGSGVKAAALRLVLDVLERR
jgi:transposase